MAIAETARLIAQLVLDDRQFAGRADKAARQISTLEKVSGQATRGVMNFGKNVGLIGVGVLGALGTQVAVGVKSLEELETVLNATAGVIKSTGGAAGVSADQVRDYAQALEATTTADDKAIQAGENLLLTFTNVGKDVFPQATKAIVDLGIAMAEGDVANADFKSSAIQIGKALNDPIKGITALTRVGVSFSAQQKKQIEDFVKAGRVADAQKVILAELEKEFGKAGQAAGTGFGADMRRAQDAIEDAQQALARGFLPVISRVAKVLSEKLADPKVIAQIESLGVGLADSFEKVLDIVLKIPWDSVADALRIGGMGAKAILDAFVSLPPWVQTAVLTGWGLNKLTGGALTGILGTVASSFVKGVLGINAGVVNVNAATVNGAGGGPNPVATAAGGLGLAASAAGVIGVAIVGFTQKAAADLAGSFVEQQTGSKFGGQLASQVQKGAGQGPLQVIGPFERLFRALGGDFRSDFEIMQDAERETAKAARDAGDKVAATQAANAVHTNDRLEAIRGYTQTQAQRAQQLIRTTERAESIATTKANEQRAAIAAASAIAAQRSRSEESAINRASAAQVSAQNAQKAAVGKVRDTVSELRGAVLKQKPPVVKVVSTAILNLSGISAGHQTLKSIYRVAS